MARPSAIALLLLLLSLLAVSQYCRATESNPATDEAGPTELVPAEQDVLLSLPSHRQEAEPSKEAKPEEVKAVAEPDTDGSLPESDGEENEDKEVKRTKKHRHHHDDDGEEDEEKAGKKKKMKLSHRHHHDDDDEEEKAGKKEKKMKLFHHRHHDEEKTGKPFHHVEADSDSDDEGELEEMVRQFRKAIRKRRSRHHHHHHAEEGGVVTWIKGLMKRF